LIAHSILVARSSGISQRIVVSTDSKEIAEVAQRFDADVPFLRPAELAGDTAPMWPVVRHCLTEVERMDDRRFDSVLLLDPTSPGRLPEDLQGALRKLGANPDADGIVGVSQPGFSPMWHSVVEKDGWMADLWPEAGAFDRRQDLPPTYRINASLYMWRRAFVESEETDWRRGKNLIYEIPDIRAFHIDEELDLKKAEALINAGLTTLPWLAEEAPR
jgi:N-acylneuraminate cytidylyltransferase